MIYLTVPPNEARLPEYRRLGVGVILTPAMGNATIPPGLVWAADTGCFKDPDGFDLGRYLRFLARWGAQAGPGLFATAPDVLADPAETWRRSEPVLPVLRELGHRAALVAQDGLADPPWDEFDCLFVGGTTGWKLAEGTWRLALEAKARGKWVHLGRVNSWRRYGAAHASAAYDSADGTYLGWGPDTNLPKLARWIARADHQPSLWSP